MKRRKRVVIGGLSAEKTEFLWKIENFMWIRQSNELLCQQKVNFQAGHSLGLPSDWCCELRPDDRKLGETQMPMIGIYLRLLKYPPECKELLATFAIQVKNDHSGRDFFHMQKSIKNYVGHEGHGWFHFMLQEVLIADPPLKDGCLEIHVMFEVISSKSSPKFLRNFPSEAMYKKKFIEKLQNDMANMLSSPTEPVSIETKIISKEGTEFKVNRDILAARSPVFQTMFQTEMTECKTGIIEIRDLSGKTVKVLLYFLYTGILLEEWRNDSNVMVELVYAADKYNLPDLLEFFDISIGKKCSKDNVGKLMSLAKKMNLKNAEKEILDFMKEHISSFLDMLTFVNQSEDRVINPDTVDN